MKIQSKAHKISKLILAWIIILFFICCMCGCAKNTDPVDNLTESAHQQIVAIRESLPKECQTKAIDEQLKAHDLTVESIKSNCDTQKQILKEEKLRWKYSFLALSTIILVYVAKKLLKIV